MYKPQRRSGVAATESPSFSLVTKRSASRGIRAHVEIDAAGVPWARIGEHVGQRSLRVTADTYTHVLSDGRELDYEGMRRGEY